MLLCAVFTWSRGAWVGMAASSFVFLIALTPRAFAVVPAAVAGGSVLCMLFPDTLGARVGNLLSLSDSANYYRVKIWNGVCRMIERYFAGGIGIGEELFISGGMERLACSQPVARSTYRTWHPGASAPSVGPDASYAEVCRVYKAFGG